MPIPNDSTIFVPKSVNMSLQKAMFSEVGDRYSPGRPKAEFLKGKRISGSKLMELQHFAPLHVDPKRKETLPRIECASPKELPIYYLDPFIKRRSLLAERRNQK